MTVAREHQNAWGMTEADDCLHPRDLADPDWVETMWFAFMVPERRLLGYVYPAFRPNQGLQYGGVRIVEGDAELPWEIPIFHWENYAPMDPAIDLRDFSLRSGMTVRCTEPGKRFELGYESRELTFSLVFDALMQPLRSSHDGPFTANGHLDQAGRVTGELVMHGETIKVDCLALRDRGWGPRRERGSVQMGYAYAVASDRSAFLSVSGTGRSGKDKVVSGFLMRDGVWSRLVSGERTAIRDGQGRASGFVINAVDELGREMEARGTVVSRMASHTAPRMLVWCSLVEWTFDGQTSWGEDQDCWSPDRWRQFIGAPRV